MCCHCRVPNAPGGASSSPARCGPLLVHPIDVTALGERILDGLEQRPDRLIVVSDGWDNYPPGQAAEVLWVWQTHLDPERRTEIVHLNPVYDSEAYDVRRRGRSRSSRRSADLRDPPRPVWRLSLHRGHARRGIHRPAPGGLPGTAPDVPA